MGETEIVYVFVVRSLLFLSRRGFMWALSSKYKLKKLILQ